MLKRGRDHVGGIEPAILNLLDVFDPHKVGARRFGFLRLVALRDREDPNRLAGAVGQRHRAANDLVGVLGIDAQAYRDVYRLVELGGAQTTVDQKRPAAPDGTVSIEKMAGSVKVTGWDKAEVQVRDGGCRRRAPLRRQRQAHARRDRVRPQPDGRQERPRDLRAGRQLGLDRGLPGLDRRDRSGLVGRVDVGQHQEVGTLEGIGEVGPQGRGAAVAVGLEHGDDPSPATVPTGGEGRGDLGGQVHVVVDERDPARLPTLFEPPVDAPEAGQPGGGRLEADPHLHARPGGTRVAGVVQTGRGTCTGPRRAPCNHRSKPMPSRPARTSAIRVGIGGGAVGERADGSTQRGRDPSSAQTTHGPVVASRKRAKAAWRFSTEPWYSRWSGSMLVTIAPAWACQERAVALVGLDDEPLAVGPRRAVTELGDTATDDEGRIRPPACSTRASMADVVVFPWVPATARDFRWAAMAASRAVRRTTATPRRRASATSGLSSGTAVEMATSSTSSGTLAGSWPTVTVMPIPRNRSSTTESRRSCPRRDGPWRPTRWRWATSPCHRWPPRALPGVESDGSGSEASGAAGSGTGVELHEIGHPVGGVGAGEGVGGGPHGDQATGWSAGVGAPARHARRRARRRAPGWPRRPARGPRHWRSGDPAARSATARAAPGGPPRPARRRWFPGPADEQVGGGEQQIHAVLVADHLVAQPAWGSSAPRPPWRRSRGSR